MLRKSSLLAAGGLLAVFATGEAAASGFQLREQSGTGQGTSFAGMTAGGEDISAMFFNPAALGRYSGNNVLATASRIAPKTTFKDGVATRSTGAAIAGATTHGDSGKDATLPSMYAMWDPRKSGIAGLERFRFGLAVNVAWGLETEYASDWLGRYHATQSAIQTLAIAPTASYDLGSGVTLGAAIVAQRIEAKLGKAVNVNQILGAGGDAFSMLYGNDEGTAGGRFGALWASPGGGTNLGVAYHTELRHTLKGDAKFFAAPAALIGNNLLRDTTIETRVALPEIASFGFQQRIWEGFTLAGEAAWTRWSKAQELRIKFASGRADDVTPLKWKDTMFVALGAIWKPSQTGPWTLRFGVAHDETPVPDSERTPRIPDQDRTWFSGGASYQWGALGFDLGYSYIVAKRARAMLSDSGATTDPNRFRGNFNGTFDTNVHIFTGQARFAF
jgi:long-chain fatty acid transport protein